MGTRLLAQHRAILARRRALRDTRAMRKDTYTCDFQLTSSCLGEKSYGPGEMNDYCTFPLGGDSFDCCVSCLQLVGGEGSPINKRARELAKAAHERCSEPNPEPDSAA